MVIAGVAEKDDVHAVLGAKSIQCGVARCAGSRFWAAMARSVRNRDPGDGHVGKPQVNQLPCGHHAHLSRIWMQVVVHNEGADLPSAAWSNMRKGRSNGQESAPPEQATATRVPGGASAIMEVSAVRACASAGGRYAMVTSVRSGRSRYRVRRVPWWWACGRVSAKSGGRCQVQRWT